MTSPAAYNVNFCFPVKELENDRVKLVPFIADLHAEIFYKGIAPHPELFNYMPGTFGPWTSATQFTTSFVEPLYRDPSRCLFAIIDKTRTPTPGAPPSETDFAGVLTYMNTSAQFLVTEIGFVVILPKFQRTHVTTHACGLLLQYALDLPSSPGGGLGLRRVQWQASNLNVPSVKAAKAMGFKFEGVLRWDRVMPGDRTGLGEIKLREGDPMPGTLKRDTAMLAVCWDDWEEGGREMLLKRMDRRS
ncbi:hypothetical protein HYDPIDRAFT_86222 [Hydnomerulius pinastri MD-312]|nr:hypothetical protein HYDPIDRAFT_86222 [Hydnomerulius pinastri MD-312]